jgi:putative nucleotidyltransferase with HDIG domain
VDLLRVLHTHDPYTAGHSVRASGYAAAIARALGCDARLVSRVRKAGLVHDIGKIGVPRTVLGKPVDLDAREHHLMRLHPVLGASILSRIPGLEEFVPIVLDHHERWDGGGYPRGVAGEDITLEARILFVADSFDAMTTRRPYGGVLSKGDAAAEISRCAGLQFDPRVVAAAVGVLAPDASRGA